MNNLALYMMTILIWGSTWYAIKFQLGVVAAEVSIGYRFALASLILFCWCWLRNLKLRFSLVHHVFLILQGAFLFSLNYFFFYWATDYLPSGINAVVFSTVIIFNIVNSALFFRTPILPSLAIGAICGVIGISVIFWPQLSLLDFSNETIIGMGLSLAGTIFASWGNMVSARNQHNHLPVVETNAYAMGYGALFTFVVIALKGHPLNFDLSFPYIGSLLYLSVLGSVLAFGSYLTLLGRIGASRAAYSLVFAPVVALIISTFFEDFTWTLYTVIGVGFIFLGSILLLIQKDREKRTAPKNLSQVKIS